MITVNLHNATFSAVNDYDCPTGRRFATIEVKDSNGNTVTLFFESLQVVRDFSRAISEETARIGAEKWPVKED